MLGLRFGVVQRIGDQQRVLCVTRKQHITAIRESFAAKLRIRRRFAHVHLAERDGLQGFVVFILQIQHDAGIGFRPGGKLKARELRRLDLFGLDDFQSGGFEEKIRDLGKTRGIIAALAHAPDVLFHQVEFIGPLFDADMEHVVDRKVVTEQFAARTLFGGVRRFVARMLDKQAGPAQNNQ